MILNSDKLNLAGTTYSVAAPDIYEEYKKTKNGELFEGLVHDLILKKYSDCGETNKFILSLPKKEQRLAIMSLVDKERKGDVNLLWREMKAYVDSRTDKMSHVKDVIGIINKFVKDGTVEKKTHGEVMTPISLVREMLDTLPKEVWSNPNLKWLDPCNGAGTFPFVVIYKLMRGLAEWEPDVEKRYKHIVENMIYTCELQSRNVFLWLCGVDPYDEYTTNTYWGSFLDEGFDKHMKEVWGLDKVDIIIGNPPYNENNSNNNNKIYFKFIKKSFNLLNNNSPLCYVLPDDSISYIVNEEKYQINYVNSNDIVGRYFKGIGTKILYFLSIKKLNFEKTKFIDTKSESYIDLNKISTILMDLEDTLLVDKINKYSDKRFEFKNAKYNGNNYRIRFNSIAKVKFNLRNINLVCVDDKLLKKHGLTIENFDKSIFKYKVIDHSSNRIEFYADKNFDNNKKRVCINTIGEINPIFDPIGDYLLTDGFIYVEVENDLFAYNLIDILNSKLCKYLQSVVTHNTKNKYKIMNYLPKLDLSRKWTDEELYREFHLNSSEISKIGKI
jgi:hypothetical protein